jgi:hypothetical protein
VAPEMSATSIFLLPWAVKADFQAQPAKPRGDLRPTTQRPRDITATRL